MKKSKLLLFPILTGMFLSACTPAPEAPKKATINIEANQYLTTSLVPGQYELNKAIEFTVGSNNEEYRIASVKMDDVDLTPSNNDKYTFTPKEEKTYTLKVTAEELDNKIVYTFEGLTEENYTQKLNRKGVKLVAETYVASDGFENVFKNNNFNVANDKMFQIKCRIDTKYDVWVRKVEFTFADNKKGLTLVNPDYSETYKDGVWTTSKEKSNEGVGEIFLKGVGEAVISKIVITTATFKHETTKLKINGLDENDKVYYFPGAATFENWEKKTLLTADTEFITLQTHQLWVEWSQFHKDFYEDLILENNGSPIRVAVFYPDPESPLPKDKIVCYTFEPVKADVNQNVLDCRWTSKSSESSIKVDVASANKYVKGFMETDPLNSLGLTNISYGGNATLSLVAKKGYMDLKVFVNGTQAEKTEDRDSYKFVMPFSKEINISFTATEGDERLDGKTVIKLNGDNADKGELLAAENEGKIYIAFQEYEDHPTAKMTALKFVNEDLTPVKDDEDGTVYVLDKKADIDAFNNAQDKSTLFTATIVESEKYNSNLIFNKGSFKVEIAGKEPVEENGRVKYEVEGKSDVTVKITPNEYLDIHSIEVNDKRLEASSYVLNEDGSISYTFNAKASSYEFLIQTKAQLVTLELDSDSTKGYIIKDLPKEAVTCGQGLNLTLAGADDDHYLEGKKITVTYNNKVSPVDEGNFVFTIIPVKGVSKIKVVVEDKAQ